MPSNNDRFLNNLPFKKQPYSTCGPRAACDPATYYVRPETPNH